MTVNEYLWRLEWLKIEKERKYERCLQKTMAATSPRSSLDLGDGIPYKNETNTREIILVEASAAFEDYLNAIEKFDSYRNELCKTLSKLDYRYQVALEHVYVWNLDRAPELRRNGLCRMLDIRKKDIPELMRSAKAQLRQVLLEQGIDIE